MSDEELEDEGQAQDGISITQGTQTDEEDRLRTEKIVIELVLDDSDEEICDTNDFVSHISLSHPPDNLGEKPRSNAAECQYLLEQVATSCLSSEQSNLVPDPVTQNLLQSILCDWDDDSETNGPPSPSIAPAKRSRNLDLRNSPSTNTVTDSQLPRVHPRLFSSGTVRRLPSSLAGKSQSTVMTSSHRHETTPNPSLRNRDGPPTPIVPKKARKIFRHNQQSKQVIYQPFTGVKSLKISTNQLVNIPNDAQSMQDSNYSEDSNDPYENDRTNKKQIKEMRVTKNISSMANNGSSSISSPEPVCGHCPENHVESLLPAHYQDEDYLDLMLDPKFCMQGIKNFRGHWQVVLYHHKNSGSA